MEIREVAALDLMPLLELYVELHGEPVPEQSGALTSLWERILGDPNHHILLGEVDEKPVSSLVLIVVPNLTCGQRPYALIENVVTHSAHRKRGYATMLLKRAKEIAIAEGCYKLMLMSGAKDDATLEFYKNAGFNSEDKTAFIQWTL